MGKEEQVAYPPVLTKKDFSRRYKAGEFGNASPTWDSLDEMEEQCVLEYARPDQLYHVRNRIAGGETWYNVKSEDLADVWYEACNKVGPNNLYISAMAPTHRTTFQGEIQQTEQSLSLYYTRVRKPMRDALREQSFQTYGVSALLLLNLEMDPNSREWLAVLLDRYPSHVVEFSCYEIEWGTIPGYKTVFWEVRGGY